MPVGGEDQNAPALKWSCLSQRRSRLSFAANQWQSRAPPLNEAATEAAGAIPGGPQDLDRLVGHHAVRSAAISDDLRAFGQCVEAFRQDDDRNAQSARDVGRPILDLGA